MAQIPTLCEVSYDFEWLADDYFYTPFRLPSADSRKHPQTFSPQFFYPRPSQNLSQAGKNDFLSEFEEKIGETTQHNTYFEYLRDYYIENSSSPLTYGGTVASPQLPSRSHLTIPARFYPTFDGCISPLVHHDHNKLPRSLPAVSRSAQYPDTEQRTTERNNLVWIDSLKSWVPMKKHEEGKPYLSFVNNPPYVEKLITATEALERKDRIEAANKNDKRSRKAYSTPLYNPNDHTCRLKKFNPLSARAAINYRNTPTPVSHSDGPTEETVEEVFGKDTHEEKESLPVNTVKSPVSFPKLLPKGDDSAKPVTNAKAVTKKPLASIPSIDFDQIRLETDKLMRKTIRISLYISKEKSKVTIKKEKVIKKSTKKIWTAPPKYELKSPKPSKTSIVSAKVKKEVVIKPQPLPVTLPDVVDVVDIVDLTPLSTPPSPPTPIIQDDISVISEELTDLSTKSPAEYDGGDEEIIVSKKARSPLKKKDRVLRKRDDGNVDGLPKAPETVRTKQSSWIYGEDEEVGAVRDVGIRPVQFNVAGLPQAPDVPDVPDDKKKPVKSIVVNKQLMPVENKSRWGSKKVDSSYEDEQRKAELAERRRKRQMEMYAKLKLRKSIKGLTDEENEEGASFDDYDFLAKYCIFDKTNKNIIQHVFETVDEKKCGWLDCTETMVALRSVNNKLTYTEEEYLYRVIEMTGYKVTHGADFKLFSVLAALSTRISSLDSWTKNIIGNMDFKTLEMKLFMCKTLWECNVDKETNTIPLEQLMIELRAGGVSFQHECQVRQKLSHLKELDLCDFLTYVPLFIMIHESVVSNPLDDSRQK
ncbi:hypothetical protein SNE40_005756 [Patella caerulea]|uniref:EF-hand domain-containing protein n=1 Tax=Patella caerulea TaxID=87958 RepID=A0AAN8QC22_PATCE